MKVVAFLLFERFIRQSGKTIPAFELDTVDAKRFPFTGSLVCYLQVEIDQADEGVPVAIRYELAPNGDGASGAVATLSNVERIAPMRQDGYRVTRFRDYMEVEFSIATPGLYEARAYVDDVPVAVYPLLAREWKQ